MANALMGAIKRPNKKKTPQSQPIPGSNQLRNNAGGFAWDVGDEQRLDRFLILGSEGGTYYVGERDLTKQNVAAVERLINADGLKVVRRVVEISEAGRAPKNDQALFVLAKCVSMNVVPYAPLNPTQSAAWAALPRVARTASYLEQFVAYVGQMRGLSGHAVSKGLSNWIFSFEPKDLAYQVLKYKSRTFGGSKGSAGITISMKDVLDVAHPNPTRITSPGGLPLEEYENRSAAYRGIFRFVTGTKDRNFKHKPYDLGSEIEVVGAVPEGTELIQAHLQALAATSEKEVIRLIIDKRLSREMIPTQFLNKPDVQEALLHNMPPTAMLRNLGQMTASGLVKPLSDAANLIVTKMNATMKDGTPVLKAKRVHPIHVLTAMMAYKAGSNFKGNLNWKPVPTIMDALEDAFYRTFDYVEPTGKKFYLAVDVSSSMTSGEIAGVKGLTPNMGAAAMAMLTARTEEQYIIRGFCHGMRDLDITAKDKLASAMKKTQREFGGTDCAIPINDAISSKLDVDAFVIYSDMETWAGNIHTAQALKQYRQKMGRDAKLIACGMTSNNVSVADPGDVGSMNIVGFDTAVPTLISDFVTGGKALLSVEGEEE